MKKYPISGWQLLVVAGLSSCSPDSDFAAATHVGGANCGSCHQKETDSWNGSHHDRAMQNATSATVLGDFNNAAVSGGGTTFTFLMRDQAYFVRAVGQEGELKEYRIDYTFGVDPLQQYLVGFPDGRLQALTVAWDTRSPEKGGQRWFDLYP
ncbi:MAG: hypothetical protein BMS9Abin05_0671 [Rhodothermia bacterium]|nr:MAG: hypothetical protein BMS9Abin05_0671 [Rhodothermia bacterium]